MWGSAFSESPRLKPSCRVKAAKLAAEFADPPFAGSYQGDGSASVSLPACPVSLSSAQATELYQTFGNSMNAACLRLSVKCGREVSGA